MLVQLIIKEYDRYMCMNQENIVDQRLMLETSGSHAGEVILGYLGRVVK